MNHEEYHEYENFIQQFRSITLNLWYTWDPEAQKLCDVLLDKTNHTLSSFERFYALPDDRKQELFRNTHLRATVDHVYRKLQDYLSGQTWFDSLLDTRPEYEQFIKSPIAYLCAEYGFTDWMQIYSGGLGILAADMLKETSDLGIPMVAVGLFYQYGFFHQRLTDDGYQTEEYHRMDPEHLPLTPIQISTGAPLLIEVTMVDHPVYCRIWTLQIGRVPLYLLDTNIPENVREEDRLITGHLYGGDDDTRIRQEIILGIGGERAISALGFHPTTFSMNEGHSAFAALEITKHFMNDRGLTFQRAEEHTRKKIIYTNHTVVPAGNDIFSYDLVKKYLSPYLLGMDISFDELFQLGRHTAIDGAKIGDSFSMPDLALEMSAHANAVSKHHAEVIKDVWPHATIIPITNGVHLPTWAHSKMQRIYETFISPDWKHSIEDHELWKSALHIPDSELWETRNEMKRQMIQALNTEHGFMLSPDALTITWARRFATYKRADMLLADIDRLMNIINNMQRPVQIIIAGKSHPKDTLGKGLMQKIIQTIRNPRFYNKIVFVPDYQISVARRLVSGSDVWLNTPIPTDEASGTSGMKACANGVLHCSTNGGWVAEVDWSGAGFLIEPHNEADSLYRLLENTIVPLYYERNSGNIPEGWMSHMKKTLSIVCPEFSTKRTLKEYFDKLYTASLKEQR